MEEKKEMPVRYSVPNIYSKAPFKEVCKVVLNYHPEHAEEYRYFIQTSLDCEHPYWEDVGDFLASVFENKLNDEKFIDQCFKTLNRIGG